MGEALAGRFNGAAKDQYVKQIKSMGYEIRDLDDSSRHMVMQNDLYMAEVFGSGVDIFYPDYLREVSEFESLKFTLEFREKLRKAKIPFSDDTSLSELRKQVQETQNKLSRLDTMLSTEASN